MYYIYKGITMFEIKFYPRLDFGYAVKEKGNKLIKSPIGSFEKLSDAKNKLSDYCNNLIEDQDSYTLIEYCITDEEKNILGICEEYKYITLNEIFSNSEFYAIKKLLEHMDFYVGMASIIVYTRYGIIRKDKQSGLIVYQDERQTLKIDPKTQIIQEFKDQFNLEFVKKYMPKEKE